MATSTQSNSSPSSGVSEHGTFVFSLDGSLFKARSAQSGAQKDRTTESAQKEAMVEAIKLSSTWFPHIFFGGGGSLLCLCLLWFAVIAVCVRTTLRMTCRSHFRFNVVGGGVDGRQHRGKLVVVENFAQRTGLLVVDRIEITVGQNNP